MIIKYKRNFTKDRNTEILKYCEWKKVLHIWACDAPFTNDRLNKKWFLYQDIDSVCSEQLWIDLDKDSIEFLNNRKEFKKSNVIFVDMNKLESLNFKPDVIIFWEVIEHLMNIEVALTNIKKVMDNNTQLIISTPNAFYLMNFIFSLFWKEVMHEDHKVLFSQWYLQNMLKFNWLIIEKSYFTFLSPYLLNIYWKISYYITRTISYIVPYWSDTLLIICKKNDK